MQPNTSVVSLLTSREVCARVGVSRPHLYRLMKRLEHPFPAQIHIGRCARWVSSEVDRWIEEEIESNRRGPK